jgi:hypothetical protein
MTSSIGRWKLRYGIKYNGGAMHTGGGLPWTVMCKISSSDWTIRLPIGVSDCSDWPVVWLSTLMVSLWVDSQLEKWNTKTNTTNTNTSSSVDHHRNQRHDGYGKSWTSSSSSSWSTTTTALPYADMIGRVAAKKKQIEASRRGLVILRAVVDNNANANGNGNGNANNNANPNQDVTNVLQFWVVESRLSLPVQEIQWGRGRSQMSMLADCEDTNTHIWTRVWNKLTGRPAQEKKVEMGTGTGNGVLTVRYQHGERVYEIVFGGDELVWLPNNRARELGHADFVA